jgi:hypothetical protein
LRSLCELFNEADQFLLWEVMKKDMSLIGNGRLSGLLPSTHYSPNQNIPYSYIHNIPTGYSTGIKTASSETPNKATREKEPSQPQIQ